MITVFSGGTGTPKLIRGLRQILRDHEITVVVNTAEDIRMSGLYVSPDIDTVQYLFSGLLNTDSWWGIRGDSFETFHAMEKLGYTELLPLGDRDRATNIARAEFLRQGMSLTKATEKIAKGYGISAKILPMSDQEVTSYVVCEDGTLMHYQEYWVKLRGNVEITGVVRKTADSEPLKTTPEVLAAIEASDGVIIGPSNPVTSIGPILECEGVREALQNTFTVAVSPFIGNRPVSGPAAALMKAWGYESTSYGTWQVYKDVVDLFIQDIKDSAIEVPGAHRLDTMMTNEKKAESLAWDLLSYFPRK
ncbi:MULTISPECIES: 2-phospho-L-lactate transferase [Methanocorpusculum]|uniref:2-phospho-L-lactate transferase n=1 Tax=Methanocorpusculum TaxID=2192 RepID=UPI0005B2E29F|nr:MULTISPECIES: 2-phospho-L-lactate transferase [Methanocorpusculum]HJJ34616.1 2-phospho-L-lactate transferase [Methanocorpusculum sp.]